MSDDKAEWSGIWISGKSAFINVESDIKEGSKIVIIKNKYKQNGDNKPDYLYTVKPPENLYDKYKGAVHCSLTDEL